LFFFNSSSVVSIMCFVTYLSKIRILPRFVLIASTAIMLCLIGTHGVKSDQRNPELDNLFSKLKTAKTNEDGELISSRIWQIWTTHSADSTLSKQMQMGIELMQSGQLAAANEVFSYLIQQDKQFAEAWNKRATVLFFMGEFEKAKHDIAQTLALESNHFGALAGLGMVEVHLGNHEAALEAYRHAALINPHLQDVKKAIMRLEEKLKGFPT